jgi:3',5'-cyclic AMP phosphodiesterase CpdA
MPAVLIHISDVHFRVGHKPKPLEQVLAAIRGLNIEPSSISLVLSGDVAYSGKTEEYESAHKYFSDLCEVIGSEFRIECKTIVCPGNHDCSFPEDTAIRDLVINDIRSKGTLPESEGMTLQCTCVQDPFFKWIGRFDPSPSVPNYRLAWTMEIIGQDGTKIGFRILNTAWMSTIHEKQGNLFFPTSVLPEIPSVDVRISLLHHPYNWFKSANGRELRRILEETSDLVLTGHEHDYDEYTKIGRSSDPTGYVEGGVFCADDETMCAFNVIQIDLANSRYSVTPFIWRNDSFTSDSEHPRWQSFVFKTSAVSRENLLSDETRRFLENPGLQLTHRAKSVTLEDIFVPPDLKNYERFDKPERMENAIIPSDVAINRLFEDRFAYILGNAQCGKTAFGKMLFLHAIRRGLTPIFLDGEGAQKWSAKHREKTVDDIIRKQYNDLLPERFWQMATEDRVIIVDGFDHINLNLKGKAQVADWLRHHFGRVFIFGGDLTQIEDLVMAPDLEDSLSGFKRYEIRPFGHFLRDVLIEKWITLGREHTIDQGEFDHKLRQTANIVNNVLGDYLLPANPVYILLLLQQLEAAIPLDTSSGSYGYFYESVLTIALQQVSRSAEDVDAKYTYLSELAWHMFQQGELEIDGEELDSFTRQHCEGFRLNKDPESLKKEIIGSHLLQQFYGRYRLTYSYFHYYFIARYMRDNINEDCVQSCIEQAAREIHREDFANILIFLTYLTKNKRVIRLVIDNAKDLFKDVEPCDLAEHVTFINRLQESIPSIVLPENDPREERRSLLRRRDQAEQNTKPEKGEPKTKQELETDQEIKQLLSINRAIKVLQVLGQILRNFSGSIKKDLKAEITEVCFDVGLRVLNSFYHSLEQHLDTTLLLLADLGGKNFSELPERQRVKVAKDLIFFITEVMCLGTLRRISYAVGSETLVRTYQDVEESYDNRATRFVQLSLRLDHFGSFPTKRILDLSKEVQKDAFGLTLLRILVAEHFRMFPRSYRIQQSICAKLGISYQRTSQSPKTPLITEKRKTGRRKQATKNL